MLVVVAAELIQAHQQVLQDRVVVAQADLVMEQQIHQELALLALQTQAEAEAVEPLVTVLVAQVDQVL
jgi:hypothetical protein